MRTFFPCAFFLPQSYNLLDDSGKIKDAELIGRLKSQLEGCAKFSEHLRTLKIPAAK
jgi:hypothetical protein